jgi:hypothetical protein
MASHVVGGGGAFGLMFPYARLTADEIERRLLSVVERTYEGDATGQRAARKMLGRGHPPFIRDPSLKM